jgi:outer membrane biosynthesis protein TonB
VDKIVESTGASREEALDLLVELYVTGIQDRVVEALGADAWSKVVDASRSASHWRWSRYVSAVHEAFETGTVPAASSKETDTAYSELHPGLVRPRPLELELPAYPRVSQQTQETGRVVADLTVTAEGKTQVDDLECQLDSDQGSPHFECPEFIKMTKRAIKRWRFSPGLLDDRPVDVRLRAAVDFDLPSGKPSITLSESIAPDKRTLEDPVPIQRVRPLFPYAATFKLQNALVIARANLDRKGNVKLTKILRSDPEGLLDKAILDAIPQWRYRRAWKEDQEDRTLEIQVYFEVEPCTDPGDVEWVESEIDLVETMVVCAER